MRGIVVYVLQSSVSHGGGEVVVLLFTVALPFRFLSCLVSGAPARPEERLEVTMIALAITHTHTHGLFG